MEKRVCLIDSCDRGVQAKGWCSMHYTRWRRHGDPEHRWTYDPEVTFLGHTEQQGDCLVWTGPTDGSGYGTITFEGRRTGAHRYAWIRSRGDIPGDLVVDHRCWNRTCVEVSHLRLVTRQQNGAHRKGANPGSATGVRGVWRNRAGFQAGFTHERVRYSRYFSDLSEAEEWVTAERERLAGEYAGGA